MIFFNIGINKLNLSNCRIKNKKYLFWNFDFVLHSDVVQFLLKTASFLTHFSYRFITSRNDSLKGKILIKPIYTQGVLKIRTNAAITIKPEIKYRKSSLIAPRGLFF
jgi:hypothetical protein